MIHYGHDDLSRVVAKDTPNVAWWETDVSYGYDNLGRLRTAGDSNGHVLTFGWDALGRRLGETSNWYGPIAANEYDLAGRRTKLTHRDGFFVNYDYLVTGEVSKIRENGATSGAGVLASFSHDTLGRRITLTRGNGTATNYGYDPVSRLGWSTQDFAGTAGDLSVSFTYNPASQIVTHLRDNDAYAWTGHGSGSTASAVDGLNRLTSVEASRPPTTRAAT